MLTVSQACPDVATAGKAITDVCECAGTGLIQDQPVDLTTRVGLPRPYRHGTGPTRNRTRAVSAVGSVGVGDRWGQEGSGEHCEFLEKLLGRQRFRGPDPGDGR